MNALTDCAHAEVTQLLIEHREQLDRLTHAPLQAETLDAPDAYAAAGVPMPTAELQAAATAAAGACWPEQPEVIAYIDARQGGSTPDEASVAAGRASRLARFDRDAIARAKFYVVR